MNAPVRLTHSARVVDPSESALAVRIEDFVREQNASLFHRPAWLLAAQAGTGHSASGILSEQMGAITGWLPLTEVRSLLFGNALVSTGFGVGGGICATSADAAKAM